MPEDPGAIWRNQPEERLPVNAEEFVNRRTSQLYATTRSEILMSIAAAVLFLVLLAWHFMSGWGRVSPLGLAAVIAWVLISMYWFRNRIWRRQVPRGDALAATGLVYYRHELEQRRDHLRNAWLWHGPLLLACLVFATSAIGNAFAGLERLRTALPIIGLLAVWTVFGIRRRLRQANEIQREIDEIQLP